MEHDSHKTPNTHPDLSANTSNDQQPRFISWDYLLAEIRERELISKKLSKYIASFEYFSKSSIFLSIVTISISIASFATPIEVPVGLIGASCGLTFSITSGFVKIFSKTIRNKK